MTNIAAKHFHFLDQLRESGVTNMYGATPYLIEAFDLIRSTIGRRESGTAGREENTRLRCWALTRHMRWKQ